LNSGRTIQHIARYIAEERVCFGRLERDGFARLSAPPWLGGGELGAFDPMAAVTLLAPVVPTKIVCVGLNYAAHAAESQTMLSRDRTPEEPLLFLKPPSAVVATGEGIVYPAGVTRVDPEAELGIVIGRRAQSLDPAAVWDHIAGLTGMNDVTARDLQRRDGQWTRAKGFDTFAPLGPWVTVGLDPQGLTVECRVNGMVRQRGNTRDLLFPVTLLVSHISRIMTLEPGDVIATGTPAGVAPVEVGDRIEVEIEGVGVLQNHVVRARS
jgi:2-keto-4-pentenoate hydratase/2-oxohepta-3-ene-1,7-dioic acid hydratase in catechol pathway